MFLGSGLLWNAGWSYQRLRCWAQNLQVVARKVLKDYRPVQLALPYRDTAAGQRYSRDLPLPVRYSRRIVPMTVLILGHMQWEPVALVMMQRLPMRFLVVQMRAVCPRNLVLEALQMYPRVIERSGLPRDWRVGQWGHPRDLPLIAVVRHSACPRQVAERNQ